MKSFSFHFYNPFQWFNPINWSGFLNPHTYTPPVSQGITLTSNQTYTARSNDVISGAAGNETVVLTPGISKVSIDGKVENISLAGGLFDYNLQISGQKLAITTGSFGSTLASLQPAATGTHVLFGDGSQTTVSLGSYGTAQIHYDTVQLLDNKTTTLGNSDTTIKGGNGNETLNIKAGLYRETVDHKVENIVLSQAYQDSGISGSVNHIEVDNSDRNTPVLNWEIAQGETHTLQFDNAQGQVSLGTDGKALFTLTDIYLDSGESYTPTTSGLSVHGSHDSFGWLFATQPTSVVLTDGIHDIQIDDAIQDIELPGSPDAYTFQDDQGELRIFTSTGTAIASLQINPYSTDTIITFGDTEYQVTDGADGIYLNDTKVSSTEPAPLGAPLTVPDSPETAGQSSPGFQFKVTLGDFGSYGSRIETLVNKALDTLSHHILASGVFDLQVLPEKRNSSVLAEAAPATATVPSEQAKQLLGATTGSVFEVEGLTGTDPNDQQTDATLYINMAHIKSFNLDTATPTRSNQYDLTSIVTHELIHAIGFSGSLPDTSASLQSPFDKAVVFQGAKPYFTGARAEAVYGGAVPLAPASLGTGSAYYHVDIPGSDDLMSSSLGKGDAPALSALDLAMLDDIGIHIVGSTPTLA